MSLDVNAIHEALAAQIRANVARDVTVYPHDPGNVRDYPCIVIRPGEKWVDYHLTMGDNGIAELKLEVAVMVAAGRIDAYIALADFASDAAASGSSIRAATESDKTFGNAVRTSVLRSCRGPEPIADADGFELVFDVEAWEARG